MKIPLLFKFLFFTLIIIFSSQRVLAESTSTSMVSSSTGKSYIDNSLTKVEREFLYGDIESSSEEFISSFISKIEVHKDSTVRVMETINYDFGPYEKHGIFRDIPLTNSVGTFDTLKISNVNVVDELGNPYTFDITNKGGLFGDGGIHIRVGDPEKTISGKHTYIISYDLKNALGYFDDRAEIYWNVTGNDWEVPISRTEAHIYVPGDIRNSIIKLASYCGLVGSKDSCNGVVDTAYNPEIDQTEIVFDSSKDYQLGQGKGMTIAAAFSKNLVAYPTKVDFIERFIKKYLFLLVPICLTIFFVRKSFLKLLARKKFYKNNPIVVEYDSNHIDPLQTASIVNGNISDFNFSAQIIYLAIQGYIKIKREDGKYSFEGTDKKQDNLISYDKSILQGITNKSEAQLQNVFYKTVSSVKNTVQNHLYDLGLLVKTVSPNVTNRLLAGVGVNPFILLFVAINPGIFIWFLFGVKIGTVFSLTCVLWAISNIFLWFLSSGNANLTIKGLELERKLLGLRLYIDMAEEERIKFHNAPEKTTEHFEKLLPFAMIFGLEKKWAQEFKDIYDVTPEWYQDTYGDTFTSSLLVDRIQTFSSSTTSSIFTSPVTYSSSSGSSFDSSGFDSGSSSGSSGGGGGGGGGGSW